MTTVDISKVQGSTEPYYLVQYLSDNHDLHTYSHSKPVVNEAVHHKLPSVPIVPEFLLYNFLLLPYFMLKIKNINPDYIYTYKQFSLTPYLISEVLGPEWIVDFRTAPTAQSKEFRDLTNSRNLFIYMYLKFVDILYTLILPQAKAIITLSEPLQNHISSKYSIRTSKIAIVPLGVDTELFSSKKANRQLKQPINIAYIGSIHPVRNLEICVNALSDQNLRTNVMIHFIGDGPSEYISQLETLAEAENVDEKIKWHGYVNHTDLPALLDRMDLGISPLPNHKSFQVSSPAKIFEYLSMGLPVICSDIQSHGQILSQSNVALFFEPGNQESFVSKLNELGTIDADSWKRLCQGAREEGLKNDWDKRMSTIGEIIE